MKRMIALILACALIIGGMSMSFAVAEKRFSVVTTIFPMYDWVREIVGDQAEHVDIHLLLDSGVDLHSYQPTAQDILKISSADMFIYVGGESDAWVENVLDTAQNQKLTSISLVQAMGEDIKMEEIVEGMEHDHEHEDHDEEEHDHEHEDHDEEEHDHEHEEEADEHVWLSLRNAEKLIRVITEALCTMDPDCADSYRTNAAAYTARLAALDARYTQTVESAAFQTMLFGDRFPFRYLADDYNLTYYAAFSGCSAESEASFATIVFLAQKLDELSLPAVLTIENTNVRIAETIVASTKARNQKILSMNSMQGITAKDVSEGASYIDIMERNLQVLSEALN